MKHKKHKYNIPSGSTVLDMITFTGKWDAVNDWWSGLSPRDPTDKQILEKIDRFLDVFTEFELALFRIERVE